MNGECRRLYSGNWAGRGPRIERQQSVNMLPRDKLVPNHCAAVFLKQHDRYFILFFISFFTLVIFHFLYPPSDCDPSVQLFSVYQSGYATLSPSGRPNTQTT